MAKRTSLDEVDEAVKTVKVIQEQIAGLLEAMTRLTVRMQVIESQLPGGKKTRKKAVLFLRKEPKNFYSLSFGTGASPVQAVQTKMNKSFLLLFFKKEALAFLLSWFPVIADWHNKASTGFLRHPS